MTSIKTRIIVYEKNINKLEKLEISNEGTKDIDKMIKKRKIELENRANSIMSEFETSVRNFNIIYENFAN